MQVQEVWSDRWQNCAHPLSHQYMQSAFKKKSAVVLAADFFKTKDLSEMINSVGEYITAVKTHVDMIEDFNQESWAEVINTAKKYDLLIFEDRKFADIGRVSKFQMAGFYDIRSWADIVTSHSISGPDVIDGIAASWDKVERIGGILLLAQMSSRGNLLSENYSNSTIQIGAASPHVLGYIGNGSSAEEISELRNKIGQGKLIWTPGVNLSAEEGVLGQRYGHPGEAIYSGSDGIIVGSGIIHSENPVDAAKNYANASWNALMER